jgi:hypothetical protein
VPEHLLSLVEKRLRADGGAAIGLGELAAVAAVLEHLIRGDLFERVRSAYVNYNASVGGSLGQVEVLRQAEAIRVLEILMAHYVSLEHRSGYTLTAAEAECAGLAAEMAGAAAAEDYARAAELREAVRTLEERDALARVREDLARAVEREDFGAAAALRDASGGPLEGWWVGKGLEGDPVGHLLHIEPGFGRWVGTACTARDLAAQQSLEPPPLKAAAGAVRSLEEAVASPDELLDLPSAGGWEVGPAQVMEVLVREQQPGGEARAAAAGEAGPGRWRLAAGEPRGWSGGGSLLGLRRRGGWRVCECTRPGGGRAGGMWMWRRQQRRQRLSPFTWLRMPYATGERRVTVRVRERERRGNAQSQN